MKSFGCFKYFYTFTPMKQQVNDISEMLCGLSAQIESMRKKTSMLNPKQSARKIAQAKGNSRKSETLKNSYNC